MASAQEEPTRVTVHLVPAPGPIRGQVANEDGLLTPFDGWLELTAALEAVRTRGGVDGSQAKESAG